VLSEGIAVGRPFNPKSDKEERAKGDSRCVLVVACGN